MKVLKHFSLIFLLHTVIIFSVNAQQFKVLVVTTTKGFYHESILSGIPAIKSLAVKNNFQASFLFENPNGFTDEYVKQFQAIIFLNTTGDIFDSTQQKVMERFIQSGKGFVGIHSASDTEYDWPWYNQLVGRMFKIHPAIQTARLSVLDNKFPGIQGFANDKWWTDEWYDFSPEKISGLNYILAVDETTYNPKAQWGDNKTEGMGKLHPVAWYHNFDGGRAFYTALGHLPTIYSDDAFLNHLYAGIFWAATGRK